MAWFSGMIMMGGWLDSMILVAFSAVNDLMWKNCAHLFEIYLKCSFPRLLEQVSVVFMGVLVATTTLKVLNVII